MRLFLSFIIILTSHSLIGQSNNYSDTIRYENGNIREILTYKKKKLIHHVAFDDLGKLIYQSPLLPNQTKPTYKFKSGRLYFDSKKLDTLVFNTNIPEMNLYVCFPGATIKQIDRYTYFIRSWSRQPKTGKGKMVIDVTENSFFKTRVVYYKEEAIEIK